MVSSEYRQSHGGDKEEKSFIPTARFDHATGDIIVQTRPDRRMVLASGVNNGLLSFLASYPHAVVPVPVLTRYLQAHDITTYPTTSIDNLSFAMRLPIIKHRYGRRDVIGFELPAGIRESLRSSMEAEDSIVEPENAPGAFPRGIQVERTGVIVQKGGFRNPEMSIVGRGRRLVLPVPVTSAEYLEILAAAGRSGIPRGEIVRSMGYDTTAQVAAVYRKTAVLLSEAPVIPSRFHKGSWHRLIINAKRPQI